MQKGTRTVAKPMQTHIEQARRVDALLHTFYIGSKEPHWFGGIYYSGDVVVLPIGAGENRSSLEYSLLGKPQRSLIIVFKYPTLSANSLIKFLEQSERCRISILDTGIAYLSAPVAELVRVGIAACVLRMAAARAAAAINDLPADWTDAWKLFVLQFRHRLPKLPDEANGSELWFAIEHPDVNGLRVKVSYELP